jgi:leukotriene-A4 hydrolase
MATDANSYANIGEVRLVHLSLDWVADFEACVLRGFATYRMEVLRDGTASVVLDAKALDISSVQLWADAPSDAAQPVAGAIISPEWQLGGDAAISAADRATFGVPFAVSLPASLGTAGSCFTLRVGYATAAGDGCSAAQWLPAAQTAGKRHPYLFTQCQAIHARALLPCQDSPGAKFTYDAAVTVPAALVALMSATGVQQPAAAAVGGSGPRTWRFVQRVPISSYLLALAVGDLASRDVGPRSRVWSEGCMVEAVAEEFGGTEAYLAAAEAVCGPYEWGRYDLLCLPPSFPCKWQCSPSPVCSRV